MDLDVRMLLQGLFHQFGIMRGKIVSYDVDPILGLGQGGSKPRRRNYSHPDSSFLFPRGHSCRTASGLQVIQGKKPMLKGRVKRNALEQRLPVSFITTEFE